MIMTTFVCFACKNNLILSQIEKKKCVRDLNLILFARTITVTLINYFTLLGWRDRHFS